MSKRPERPSHRSSLSALLPLLVVVLAVAAVKSPGATSFRFAADAGETTSAAGRAPFDLTASDGTGLDLVNLDANGVLDGPLAFSELHLTFENPRAETIEGRFRITLPPGAAISRFAMKIGEHWQEGEVVERQRARQIYEDFLHRRQDPALLEKQAGNEFSARVFPIPARSRKELIVSYSHNLERADEPYVIPLLGLPEIERLDLRVLTGDRAVEDASSSLGGTVSERRIVELHKSDWTPDRDFELPQSEGVKRRGLRHENLVALRVAPEIETADQEIEGLFLLVDSSASRALGYDEQIDRVASLVAGLAEGSGPRTPVAVAAFDQVVTPIYDGTAAGFGEQHVRALQEHRALGASDLHRALHWLGGWLGEHQGSDRRRFPRVLVVSDGIVTAGASKGGELAASVNDLDGVGVERLDVLAVGGLRDEAALARLVAGHLEHDGQVLDGALSLDELATRLTRTTRSGLDVEIPGAEWVWPRRLDGVQPGDEFLVFADLPAARPLTVRVGGREVDLGGPLAAPEEPVLLERAWIGRRIERLLHLAETDFATDTDLRRAMASEVTRLSVEHRVMSPYTAFLVLETEHDYRRYGLERRALADILTVGAGGLATVDRSAASPPQPIPRPRPIPAPRPMPKRETPTAQRDADAFRAADDLADAPAESEPVVAESFAAAEPSPASAPSVSTSSASVSRANERLEGLRDEARQLEEELESLDMERRPPAAGPEPRAEESRKKSSASPHTGPFAEVQDLLTSGQVRAAYKLAEAWVDDAPGDVLALLAYGDAAAASGDLRRAARAYGSLIDLFPARADLRRHAGERLETLISDDAADAGGALELAIDTYSRAVEERPDHPSGHRLLAWSLWRAGRQADAVTALEAGLDRQYPAGRFAGVRQVLIDDLALLGAAWLDAEPDRHEEIERRLGKHGARLAAEPSLRFILTWENDANDVDLHVYDGLGNHAFYSRPSLPTGGRLVADVTTGYGPEGFVIPGAAKDRAHPYRVEVHYYRRGPMGYGLGTLHVVEHDGTGNIELRARPFVVMTDGATVELGTQK